MRIIDKQTAQAVRRFQDLISPAFNTAGLIVFGSRARGTHQPDSDADVAVLLESHQATPRQTVLALSDIAFDVLLETGINITALPILIDQWQHPERHPNQALLHNIAAEGIRL